MHDYDTASSTLHIPRGINFDCSFCGNCCFQWPVPLTSNDFKQINAIADREKLDKSRLFKVLRIDDEKLKVFSHSLEKADDGLCPFLSDDCRCTLHSRFGPEAKPSMCRLFPYTFTQTPSGVYVSLSFASSAVLLNSGRALTEQSETLAGLRELFCELFCNLNLDWSNAQLIDGTKLSWRQYLSLEEPLLERLIADRPGQGSIRIDRVLFEESQRFRKLVPASTKLDNLAGISVKAKIVDQVLIKHLLATYFPEDVYSMGICDLDTQSVAREFLAEPESVWVDCRAMGKSGAPGAMSREAVPDNLSKRLAVSDLLSMKLGRLPENCEDLLRRFIYCRVFSKLYFGPGFNYLSVLAGLHHLCVLVSLLRIKLKVELILRGEEISDDRRFLVLAECVRTLERRLTTAAFSRETMAMLEVLLASPARVERILSLAA